MTTAKDPRVDQPSGRRTFSTVLMFLTLFVTVMRGRNPRSGMRLPRQVVLETWPRAGYPSGDGATDDERFFAGDDGAGHFECHLAIEVRQIAEIRREDEAEHVNGII